MTTVTYISPLDNTTTTGFRAWGKELSDAFISAGAIRTADTGQVDWTTVTRPAAGTTAEASVPYDVFRLPSASSPLYFKVGYTTPTIAPNYWGDVYIQVGTGSDGAGNITGQSSGRFLVCTRDLIQNAGSRTVATSAPTYVCVTEDFVGLLFKDGLGVFGNNFSSSEQGFFFCMRVVDSTGMPTTSGYTFHWPQTRNNNNGGAQVGSIGVKTSVPTATYPSQLNSCAFIPQSYQPSTDASGNYQLYTWWASTPDTTASNQCFSYRNVDIAKYTVFSATLVGNRSRTYIAFGTTVVSNGDANSPLIVGAATGSAVFNSVHPSSSPSIWGNAMLWE